MKRNILSYLLGAALLMTAGPCLGGPEKPEDFDRKEFGGDGNGRLNGDEVPRWLLFARKVTFSSLDTDFNLQVSRKEIDAWMNQFDVKIPLRGKLEADGSLTFANAPVFRPEVPAETKPLQPFKSTINGSETYLQLRKGLADISYNGTGAASMADGKGKTLAAAEPASLGFYRNNLTDDDTWAVEGVLAYPFTVYEPARAGGTLKLEKVGEGQKPGTSLSGLYMIPSVEFQRITGAGDGTPRFANEVDLLAFRTGLWADVQFGEDAPFNSMLVSANYRGMTDFSFEEDWKSTAELDVELTRAKFRSADSDEFSHPRLGVDFAGLPGLEQTLQYKVRFIAHAEYGEQALLVNGVKDDALRMGPRLWVTFKPGARFAETLQRLQIYARYDYLWTASGPYEDVDYLEAGLRYPIDPKEQVLLEARYRRGEAPPKYSDIDLFYIGLGVKF